MLDNLIQLILKQAATQADPDVINLELLEAAWPALVGKEMARRTRPREWQAGTLHIDVSTHAWVQELSFHREELLGRIARLFPWKLERLHLSVAEHFTPLPMREEVELIEEPRPHKKKDAHARPLTASDEQAAEHDMAQLDEEMQAMLRKIRGHIKQQP